MNSQLPQNLPSQTKDYFGNEQNQVKNYEAYRPKYPNEIISLMKETAESGDKKAYLDIACGTGQLLFQLQNHFEKSIGTDISEKQLSVVEELIKSNNLSNSVYSIKADCHQLPNILQEKNLPTKFDLITVGQALHWFDVHPFLKMVGKDLLKPDGSLIIASYYFKTYDYNFDNEEMSQRAASNYLSIFEEKTYPLYQFDCNELIQGYPNYRFNEIYKFVKKIEQIQKIPATVDQFINFIKTFSAYNTYVELNSQNEGYLDPAEQLRIQIEKDIEEYLTKNNLQQRPQQPLKIESYFHLRLLKQFI
ncbi:UbiE/COQ5 family methyltransferase (macronuclear) [Tetrahymena thermophila SB210]|uniref:UbiE/COQ5 family methyltransferase n=1 Tax=Tetrahymena thermophila (strain SB210) TaxID=312017 RepID=Q245D9_TETTS|nr:UbiE/COQ5 family methyltransferase [Tetrahymena thermophila SB210]EAS03425.2 UbiE/COQ5 family methyltransferase [Tetrahymena thermophila SB210]|eukprot:XP_001023670.2 UbiE/COQ5 family methyltransferase [Tetrahymena thermophila SB210]